MVQRRGSAMGRVSAGLGVVTAIVMAAALYMMFIYAPTDAVQGQPQRIFYIHVPIATIAFLSSFVLAVGGIGYLVRRSQRWDRLARASAEIGLIFTTLVLLTGSLWGRPIWGTWWTWDARLTTTLILWFIYLGYFMLRAYAGDADRAARYSAVLGIIGAIDVPIIYLSVDWWRTLHPGPVLFTSGGPAMPGSMFVTFMVSLLAFTLLYVWLMYQKYMIESVKDRVAERQFQLAERQAEIREGMAL
ncbi:MAG TPA: cytochrome c biogenesis protein CcsA [Thermomicrobiaceae bacterium]|nr:cytochrome c biogenesis protein CcsA [Thermomicrobiaceae bacterium]